MRIFKNQLIRMVIFKNQKPLNYKIEKYWIFIYHNNSLD